MPELLIDFITSLDGYGAAEGWPGWWGLEGPEYLAWLGDDPEESYTTLMGANTYRLMSGLAADGEPGTDVLAGMSKVVFSSTLTEPLSWPNTQLVSHDPVEAVREMKDKGTSMRTLGSLTLCRSLLRAGLVDRFRVVVFPVITGKTGRDRIYDGYPDVSLELVESRTFDGRSQLLEYRPTVLAGAPRAPSHGRPGGFVPVRSRPHRRVSRRVRVGPSALRLSRMSASLAPSARARATSDAVSSASLCRRSSSGNRFALVATRVPPPRRETSSPSASSSR